MDFELNEEQRALADSVKAFIDERVDPRMPEIERTNAIPPELLKEAADLGLFGISIPEEYGGSNLSRLSRVLVHQMLGRSGFGFASSPRMAVSVPKHWSPSARRSKNSVICRAWLPANCAAVSH